MKKTLLMGLSVTAVMLVGAFLTLSLTDRFLFLSPPERLPAEVTTEPLKSTFYKNVPRLRLQFVSGTKREDIEWLSRYEIILFRYDPESGIAEIAPTDPGKNIAALKESIETERAQNLLSIIIIE